MDRLKHRVWIQAFLCLAVALFIIRAAMLAKSDTLTAVCYSLLALFCLGAIAVLNEK